RFSPVSTESKNRPTGSPGDDLSRTARYLASGDQDRELELSHMAGVTSPVSASNRSGPPSGEISMMAALPSGSRRRKAMERPSGDHAGLKSSAGLVVRRRGDPAPINLT